MSSLYYNKLLQYNFNGVFAVTESNEADGAGSGHVEGTAEGKLWKSKYEAKIILKIVFPFFFRCIFLFCCTKLEKKV